jgi:hypothetical protein
MIGLKPVSCLLQLFPELDMIVDFAVKGDHQCVIGGLHWLSSASKIYDRETPMPEEDLVSGPESVTIWTAVAHPIGHPHQMVAASFAYESSDPAHKVSPYLWRLSIANSKLQSRVTSNGNDKACIAHKSLEICERCRLQTRSVCLRAF